MTNPVIIELARELAERLAEDVALASTRMEHVRVTARANAAANLLLALQETETTTADEQTPTLF